MKKVTLPTSVEKLFLSVQGHPEMEDLTHVRNLWVKVLTHIPNMMDDEFSRALSINSLLQTHRSLLFKIGRSRASNLDKDSNWEEVVKRLDNWDYLFTVLDIDPNGELEKRYLDWSYVPKDHSIRISGVNIQSIIADLYYTHPECIIAPILRMHRSFRH